MPTLAQCAKYDLTPAVTMACAGVYDEIGKGYTAPAIANQIIPVLAPMLANDKLSLSQFRTVSSIMRSMLERIEQARLGKLTEQVTHLQTAARLQPLPIHLLHCDAG